MRTPRIGMRAASRTAIVVALAAAIIAAGIHGRREAGSNGSASILPATRPGDPLARELERCRAIGLEAKDDATCEAAAHESLRRFLQIPPRTPATPGDR